MKAELSREEKKERRERTLLVTIPAVYRERGYLLLTLSRNSGHINYLDVRSGSYKSLSAEQFIAAFDLAEHLDPIALALNLLGRATEGTWISARVKRRLLAMLTKEELLKLSERALAREYSRVMEITPPLQKVATERKERYIDEMLAKIASGLQQSEAAETPPAVEASPASGAQPEEQKEHTMSKKGKPKKAVAAKKTPANKAAAPKEKKEKKPKGEGRAPVIYGALKKSIANPYRPGSKKVTAFEIFSAGGDRQTILEAIRKLGVTDSTAVSWVGRFQKYALAQQSKQ